MFGSPILDVAIGLIFLYLLLSLISSAVNELIEGWLKNRAKDLEKGLRELLQDPNGTGLVKRLYEHPLVYGLFAGEYVPGKTKNLPSYIPARTFALALLDLVPAGGPAGFSAGAGTAVAPAPLAVADGVSSVVEMFRKDATTARENVENWFNSSMERVCGWYKRRTQLIIFCIGLAAALLTNADSVTVAKGLISDGTMRNSAVAAATTYLSQNNAGTPATGDPDARLKNYMTTLSGVGLPIGWDQREFETVPGRIPADFLGWLLKVAGCFLTACAVSLGAPFWFDMLNKIMTARSTIKPQEKRGQTAAA